MGASHDGSILIPNMRYLVKVFVLSSGLGNMQEWIRLDEEA